MRPLLQQAVIRIAMLLMATGASKRHRHILPATGKGRPGVGTDTPCGRARPHQARFWIVAARAIVGACPCCAAAPRILHGAVYAVRGGDWLPLIVDKSARQQIATASVDTIIHIRIRPCAATAVTSEAKIWHTVEQQACG